VKYQVLDSMLLNEVQRQQSEIRDLQKRLDQKDVQGVDTKHLAALSKATQKQQTQIHEQQEQIAQLVSQLRAIESALEANGRTGSEIHTVKAEQGAVRQ
jgi:hypothetical protein